MGERGRGREGGRKREGEGKKEGRRERKTEREGWREEERREGERKRERVREKEEEEEGEKRVPGREMGERWCWHEEEGDLQSTEGRLSMDQGSELVYGRNSIRRALMLYFMSHS